MHVIHPDVLEVQAGVRGAGTLKIIGQCDGVKANGCVGPPAAFGSVTLGGFINKEISHTFLDTVACF